MAKLSMETAVLRAPGETQKLSSHAAVSFVTENSDWLPQWMPEKILLPDTIALPRSQDDGMTVIGHGRTHDRGEQKDTSFVPPSVEIPTNEVSATAWYLDEGVWPPESAGSTTGIVVLGVEKGGDVLDQIPFEVEPDRYAESLRDSGFVPTDVDEVVIHAQPKKMKRPGALTYFVCERWLLLGSGMTMDESRSTIRSARGATGVAVAVYQTQTRPPKIYREMPKRQPLKHF